MDTKQFVQPPQKVLIAQSIEKKGFMVGDFKPSDSTHLYTLEYLNTGLRFSFIMKEDSYLHFLYNGTTYTPNRKPFSYEKGVWLHITDALSHFENWLKNHVTPYIDAQNTQDPWRKINDLFNEFEFDDDDKPFSQADQKVLQQKLSEFRSAFLKEFPPNEEDKSQEELTKRLFKKIEEVSEKVDKLSKSQIRALILGSVVDYIVKASLASTVANQVYDFIVKYFANWNYLPPILPLLH